MWPWDHFWRSGLVALLVASLIMIMYGGYSVLRSRSTSQIGMGVRCILFRWQFWSLLFVVSLWQHLLDDGLAIPGWGASAKTVMWVFYPMVQYSLFPVLGAFIFAIVLLVAFWLAGGAVGKVVQEFGQAAVELEQEIRYESDDDV